MKYEGKEIGLTIAELQRLKGRATLFEAKPLTRRERYLVSIVFGGPCVVWLIYSFAKWIARLV